LNFSLVVTELARLLLLLAGLLAVVACYGVVDVLSADVRGDWIAPAALGISSGVAVVVGSIMRWSARRARRRHGGGPGHLGRREAILLVAGSWVLGSVLAALPYWIWGVWIGEPGARSGFQSPVRCLFESISGLTTTGASVVADVEALPPAILLWRSTTQWVGGLGIVLLFVAVLPSLGVGGKRMFLAESTGPSPEGLRPHVRSTARVLWGFYLALTVAQVLLLMAFGLGVFDAVNHAFATVSTGGFSTRNASIAAFDSLGVEAVIVLFMLLGGVNFAIYDRLVKGRFDLCWKDTELRLYLGILAAASLVVAASLVLERSSITTVARTEVATTVPASLRASIFTVVSIMTTTGFSTADFDYFPVPAVAVVLVLMFIGGCAGSTAGGVKVIRAWIGARQLAGEVEREYRPSVVRPIRLGRRLVDPATVSSSIVLLLAAMIAILLGSFAVVVFESGRGLGGGTAFSAALSCLGNVGPGLGEVGAVEPYAVLGDRSLVVLSLLMLLGRLEFFAVLAIFTRSFWSRG